MAKRPQVNTDLGSPEAVRVTANPAMDRAPTYSLQQSRAGALAQSLVSIAPTLQSYVKEFEEDYRVDEENRAADTIQGMTFEDAQAMVKSGQMRDTESPWYQAAFEKQFGMVYAGRRKRELVDAYNNNFDKHNGDLDQFIAEFAGEDLDKFGGSKFIMSGYRDGMKGVLPTLRDQHAEWQSGWTRERVTEGFGSIVYDAVSDAVENGGDLNEVLGLLKGDHRESFGMTFKEMDGHIFSTAERFAAEGNVEAVEAILGTDMVGPDGTIIGSYLNRPQFATKAAEMLETAKAKRGETQREENTSTVVSVRSSAANGTLDKALLDTLTEKGQFTSSERENLLVQNERAIQENTARAQTQQFEDAVLTSAINALHGGSGHQIVDQTVTLPNGTTKTFTREKLLEGAATKLIENMTANNTPIPVMVQELARWGVDHQVPQWEALLSNAHTSLTTAITTPDKDGKVVIPDNVKAGYALYKAMGAAAHTRSRHINDPEAEKVWETAELLEMVGYEAEDALTRAASPASHQAAANSFGREEFTALADSIKPGLFGEEIANGAEVLSTTERLAKFFISRGVPKKKAVEAAIKNFEDSHTVINGTAIDTRNVHLPANFEDASLVTLQEFAETYGEDIDDITLKPEAPGSSNWIVVYKANTAMPVPGAQSRIHSSQITRAYEVQKEEAAEAAFRVAQEAIEVAAAEEEVKRLTLEAYAEWQEMTRAERRAAGLPESIVGGQNHFSVNRAIKEHRRQVAGDRVVEEKQTAREQMQSPEADALFEQMGFGDPFSR